jgi:hypothetical protein
MYTKRYKKTQGGGIKEFFIGKTVYPTNVQKVLNDVGNETIVSINICREPILPAMNKIINVATFGEIDRQKARLHYDNLFHLFMKIELSNGEFYKIDKNEIIRITRTDYRVCNDSKPVNVNKYITLQDFMENGLRRYGADRILNYDSVNANCQIFIRDILESNGLLNNELETFILQDIREITKNIPQGLKWLSSKLVRLGQRLQYLMGEGHRTIS